MVKAPEPIYTVKPSLLAGARLFLAEKLIFCAARVTPSSHPDSVHIYRAALDLWPMVHRRLERAEENRQMNPCVPALGGVSPPIPVTSSPPPKSE